MKNYISICFILLPLVLVAQGFEEFEKKSLAINKVKTKTQFMISNQISGKTAEIDYTKEGDIKEKSSYSNKGAVTSTERYEYDANGNRTYYERTNQSGSYWKRSDYNENNVLLEENGFDGSEHFRNQYQYNDDGRPTEITYIVNNSVRDKRVYTHNGNTAMVEALRGGASLYEKIKLVYDNNNNILEETVIGLDGNITSVKKYTYDNSQVLTEEKYFGGNLIYRMYFEYDENGRLLSQSEEKPSVEKFVEKSYTYNEMGLLTEYKWRRNGKEKFNIKNYTYNEKNLCIEIDTYYPATDFRITSGYDYEFY